MKKLIPLLFLPFCAQADWVVKKDSWACLTLESLKYTERMNLKIHLQDFEDLSIENNCTKIVVNTPTMPVSIGVYAKAEMLNYENKRKLYYVNSRDLTKGE